MENVLARIDSASPVISSIEDSVGFGVSLKLMRQGKELNATEISDIENKFNIKLIPEFLLKGSTIPEDEVTSAADDLRTIVSVIDTNPDSETYIEYRQIFFKMQEVLKRLTSECPSTTVKMHQINMIVDTII